jgi:pimeloyl-ACP methyl ester carboxylesterase
MREPPTAERFVVVCPGGATVECYAEGHGPAVVLLPSLGRGAEDYAGLARLIAAAGCRVLLPQPRGIGESRGAMENVSLHDLAADVAALLDHEGNGRAVVAGHAFGSRVARVVTHDRPDLVRGVALLAAAGRRPISPEMRRAIDGSGDPSLSREERLARLRAAFFAPGHDPSEWLEGWHPDVAAMQKAATARTAQDVFIKAGTAPVLEVQAELDAVVPRECADDLRNELGVRVTVALIRNAGHALVPEQPAAVAAAMLGWMAGLVL